ncbi:phage protease [Rahnella contaminans]|uniref:phage protease n=1 Tax=Rahnella contaminans TaxID=2703882 RepID=UPI003C2EB1D4
MKTHSPKPNIATAALSTETIRLSFAAFSAFDAQQVADDIEPGWKQLLPAGKFSARDGRPYDVPGGQWLMDEFAFQLITDRLKRLNQPVLIDYDHQTLYATENGQQAKAAGWVQPDGFKFDAKNGLLIRPDMTDPAQALIDSKEYKYLSAVINYDQDTGRVYEVRMIAITNDPAIVGLKELAALSARINTPNPTTEIIPVTEEMKKLLGLLGITVEDGKTLTAEQGAAALSAVQVLQTSAGTVAGLQQQVTALSAQPGGGIPDPSKYVPVAVVDGLTQQLAALSADKNGGDIGGIIEKARAEGRVFEAEVDWLKNYGKTQGVAALSAYVEKRPAIPGLTTTQSSELPDKKDANSAALSADDLAVIRVTGISQEDFIKARQQEQK